MVYSSPSVFQTRWNHHPRRRYHTNHPPFSPLQSSTKPSFFELHQLTAGKPNHPKPQTAAKQHRSLLLFPLHVSFLFRRYSASS
ncbi:hypothetical protein R3W88_018400 [Solanum pinnatisectum]|uniref:Uncharacterized protein n=1 Tax=Solanum pinnatisectum TaxID=50273 RepID=A0AAV9L409_9SOLN|nr:hypothetical protein R3W88_018400 [Solanum pinnatisectum]